METNKNLKYIWHLLFIQAQLVFSILFDALRYPSVIEACQTLRARHGKYHPYVQTSLVDFPKYPDGFYTLS